MLVCIDGLYLDYFCFEANKQEGVKMYDLLKKGVVDFFGLILGSLIGYGFALALGLNFDTQDYNLSGIVGVVLVGLSGGFGLQAARRWRSRNENKQKP